MVIAESEKDELARNRRLAGRGNFSMRRGTRLSRISFEARQHQTRVYAEARVKSLLLPGTPFWGPHVRPSSTCDRRSRLRLCSRRLLERFHQRLDKGENEAGLPGHWDELVPFVDSGPGKRVGAGMSGDYGFRRELLLIRNSRQADRRNQDAEGSRSLIDGHSGRNANQRPNLCIDAPDLRPAKMPDRAGSLAEIETRLTQQTSCFVVDLCCSIAALQRISIRSNISHWRTPFSYSYSLV